MIELELKAVVPDLVVLRDLLIGLDAREVFVGWLQDCRFDSSGTALGERGEALRVRIYRPIGAAPVVSLDWKGPTRVSNGYKQREELSVAVADPDDLIAILNRLGYDPMLSIDREIWQYVLDGATVRLERYPRMDDLVEVEGEPAAIEAVIQRLGLARSAFTSEGLPDFIARFEARTGTPAVLSRHKAGKGGTNRATRPKPLP